MRNPARIKEVLNLIQLIWEQQPDTRFNQLIYNLQREYKGGDYIVEIPVHILPQPPNVVSFPDLFNVEDEDFIEFLQDKYTRGGPSYG